MTPNMCTSREMQKKQMRHTKVYPGDHLITYVAYSWFHLRYEGVRYVSKTVWSISIQGCLCCVVGLPCAAPRWCNPNSLPWYRQHILRSVPLRMSPNDMLHASYGNDT